jgi:hypothetical protein
LAGQIPGAFDVRLVAAGAARRKPVFASVLFRYRVE